MCSSDLNFFLFRVQNSFRSEIGFFSTCTGGTVTVFDGAVGRAAAATVVTTPAPEFIATVIGIGGSSPLALMPEPLGGLGFLSGPAPRPPRAEAPGPLYATFGGGNGKVVISSRASAAATVALLILGPLAVAEPPSPMLHCTVNVGQCGGPSVWISLNSGFSLWNLASSTTSVVAVLGLYSRCWAGHGATGADVAGTEADCI